MKKISVADNIAFCKSVDILNECFGKKYKAWMKAAYFLSENEIVWFPKRALFEGGQYVAQNKIFGCINTISSDGMEIQERHSSACGTVDVLWRYVFMKSERKQEYRFVGVFSKNYKKSSKEIAVYRRVSDELDLSRWI